MKPLKLCCFFLLFFLYCISLPVYTVRANEQTVRLPMKIDISLLRSMMVSTAFREPGEKITFAADHNSCSTLMLKNPEISENGGNLHLLLGVSAQAGTLLMDRCISPIQWNGFIHFILAPKLTEAWGMTFQVVSSQLLDQKRNPAQLANIIWRFVEPEAVQHIHQMTLDLYPPVNKLQDFLIPLFSVDRRDAVNVMVESMRPDHLVIANNAIQFDIIAAVTSVFDPGNAPDVQLSTVEVEQLTSIWEKWDSLLVYIHTLLLQYDLLEHEKSELIQLLLDSRYEFVTSLGEDTLQRDFVRNQFVESWRILSPIFKRHVLLQQTSVTDGIGYLAFVSSADALLVFDRLGPTLGMEISAEGLLRLLEMLNGDPRHLEYREGINTYLRKLFDLETSLDKGSSIRMDSSEEGGWSQLRKMLNSFLVSEAFAAAKLPTMADILKWKVPKNDVSQYVAKVNSLITEMVRSELGKKEIPQERNGMFKVLIPAMAWQESCYRQFVVKGGKLTYLLSYNNTSVGLMQINERVWRGLYDRSRLRWDIRYNAAAGGEIAALYLRKYAMNKERTSSLDDDMLARIIYAMYNGGPSQYDKFLERVKRKSLYDSDTLFHEKLDMVKSGKVDKVRTCLVGGD